jgi:hypothetical protein
MNDDLQQACNTITAARRQMFNAGPHTRTLRAAIDKMLNYIQNAEKGRTKLVEPVLQLYESLLHPMSLVGNRVEILFDKPMRDRVEGLADEMNTIFEREQLSGPNPGGYPTTGEDCEVAAVQLSKALDRFGVLAGPLTPTIRT